MHEGCPQPPLAGLWTWRARREIAFPRPPRPPALSRRCVWTRAFGLQRARLRLRRQPRGGQVRRIEVVLAGNADQGEQGIAAGVGEGSAQSMGRGRLADRADRPVRGHPFAGGMDEGGGKLDQPMVGIDGRRSERSQSRAGRGTCGQDLDLRIATHSESVRLPSRGNGETMVAVRDFSGLAISACAFASAAASAPMLLLERCMAGLQIESLETDRAGFRSLRPHPMS